MTRTRDVLWGDVESIYGAILDHPFITGLTDGSLPRAAFRHYIVQDAHYLRGYAKALAACAAKAPDENATVMFAEHAAVVIAAERDLHAALMADLGSSAAEAAADDVLAETDRVGATLSTAVLTRMREHFTTTSRYEWMSWDADWHEETWPV